jgi:hypothetical protein
MSNFLKTIAFCFLLTSLSGCSDLFKAARYITSFFHEDVVFFYTSTNYPDQILDKNIKDHSQRTLIFGPYKPTLTGGGGGFGGDYESYKGPMEGEEIVALWRMPTQHKILRYYVRSKPNKGIIRAPRNGRYAYKVGVSLGPMKIGTNALSKNQHPKSKATTWNIDNEPIYYRWGDWDKLYYVTGIFDSSDLMEIPRTFHEIQAIAISEKQYDKLYKRCHSDWQTVKCFMDESFPDLTPEQLAYIQSRKHPDDDDRLTGKFPKPERRVNHWL